MKVFIQIFDDVVRLQLVAEEPGMRVDATEEYRSGKVADELRKMGNGEHVVGKDFFVRLQSIK